MKDPVLSRKINEGYKALFYGPSGTGKTLVSSLLGQQFSKEVFRIDLSQVVSKYIGETEKNLEKVFAKAEKRDWILFFDEADALFGKRSQVQNAHDKYANQEVSYLLQRIEDFPGLVILASNFKSNIDPAFLRRFNSIIEFPLPATFERHQLWQKALPSSFTIGEDVDIKFLAEKYTLTGSTINQVVHYATLQMHHRQMPHITQSLLLQGIQKELKKEDKLLR
jgi:SpoVK/Ycf46/Vps4 family AAA+-type ATPase